MKTKKQILQQLKSWMPEISDSRSEGIKSGIQAAITLIEAELAYGEWIRFDERTPVDDDFTKVKFGEEFQNQIHICDADTLDIGTVDKEFLQVGIFDNPEIKNPTHWRRISIPTKQLPTQAEILDKLEMSEEELKEIIK